MDNNVKNIYKSYLSTLQALKNATIASIRYDRLKKKLKIYNGYVDIGEKPYAVLGIGKSSSFIVRHLCSVLPIDLRIFATCFSQEKSINQKFETVISDHPVPKISNFNNTKEILTRLKKLPRNSNLILVISGGGSSMFALPEDEVSYSDKILINKYLLASKLNCREANEIRKTISKVKGGKLLSYINASSIINLIISDDALTMNDPSHAGQFVASGPSTSQTLNGRDTYEFLYNSEIWDKISLPTKHFISSIRDLETINAPQYFQNIESVVLANIKSFVALLSKNLKLIYKNVLVRPEPLFCDVNVAADLLLNEFVEKVKESESLIYIAGGEVTCEPTKKSEGGRCQHFVSLLIPKTTSINPLYCFAFATDGEDYIKNVGGAFVSPSTYHKCLKKKLDYGTLIADYNSNILLSAIDNLFKDVPINLNLGDVYMICKL